MRLPTLSIAVILALLVCLRHAPAATMSVSGGDDFGSALQNVDDLTIDLGFKVPSLPASPNRLLIEGGGDGNGTAIALIGNELVVYFDIGGSTSSTPTDDEFFSVDISSFAGKTVSIRLNIDFQQTAGNDLARLDVFDGSSTLTSGDVNPAADFTTVAGGDSGTVGGYQGSIAGEDESTETGFPDMAQFANGDYDLPDGANVLGADTLVGTLYIDEAAPGSIPDPSTWQFIPEPSTGLLAIGVLLCAGLVFRRR